MEIDSNSYLPKLALSLLILSITVGVGAAAKPDLYGSFENDLYFLPENDFLDYKSELDITYRMGGIDFKSESVFYKENYYSQLFGLSFPLGLLDIDSTLSFNPAKIRLNYFLGDATFTLAGLGIDNTFLLEYVNKEDSYGSGYELTLYGRLPSGPTMYVENYFGMKENEAEALGLEEGSGYTIVTKGYGPSQLQYVATIIELGNLHFGCVDFMSTTKISEQKGFEHTTLEFDLASENFPLQLEGELKFTPQTKSIELDPRLDLDWACFKVYTDLSTPDDEDLLVNNSNEVSTIGALEVEGFGITGVNLGHVSFSSLTALKGNLNRLTDQEDMDLRADDYVLDPDPVYTGLYTETPYDEIISIEKSGPDYDLTFGGDIYFDMSNSEAIFDTALFTGSGQYQLSDQFSLGAGVAMKPGELEAVRFSFDYYF